MTTGSGSGGSGWLRRVLGPAAPTAARPLPELSLPPGDGDLVWMRIGAGYDHDNPAEAALSPVMGQLLDQLHQLGLRVVVSRAEGIVPKLGKTDAAIPEPASTRSQIEGYLKLLQPDVILLIGAELPNMLIEIAEAEDIPVILAEARIRPRTFGDVFKPFSQRSGLSRVTRLLLPDRGSLDAALQRGIPSERLEMVGPLTAAHTPLPHNEVERNSLAEAFAGRQLWLAACVNEAEEHAIIEAQLTLLRYSHRALLIALPADPRRSAGMAARMTEAGLIVAQRAEDEDPTEEVNVYLVDDVFEIGLWYRMAPVCFMGTTLEGPLNAQRNPFEAASLGSAAIHGPQLGIYAPEWTQIDAAGAACRIERPQQLAEAVVRLLAPDQAAILATNGWELATGGAGVASRIAHAVRDAVEGEFA